MLCCWPETLHADVGGRNVSKEMGKVRGFTKRVDDLFCLSVR